MHIDNPAIVPRHELEICNIEGSRYTLTVGGPDKYLESFLNATSDWEDGMPFGRVRQIWTIA
jgi:hypothetical protein